MAKLIDANAFIEHHCKDCPYRLEGSCADEDPICSTIIDLKDFPTVEVVHGRWKLCDGCGHICSICGFWVALRSLNNYCPNCGADMRERNN